MSDTPRTDALWQAQDKEGWHDIDEVWEHARQLECENTQMRAAVSIWQKLADERKEQIAAQSERLIAIEQERSQPSARSDIERDAARYRWLRSHDKYEYPAMLGFAQVLLFQPTDELMTDQYKRLSGEALDAAIDVMLSQYVKE